MENLRTRKIMKKPTKPKCKFVSYDRPTESHVVSLYRAFNVYDGTSLSNVISEAKDLCNTAKIDFKPEEWIIQQEYDCSPECVYVGSATETFKNTSYKLNLTMWKENEENISKWETLNADKIKKYEDDLVVYNAWVLEEKVKEARRLIEKYDKQR